MTPHARHLAEMRATREPEPFVVTAVRGFELTDDEIDESIALYCEEQRDRNMRTAYPDPTQRHLAEMRRMAMETP